MLKRAKFFIVCGGKSISPLPMDNPGVIAGAVSERSEHSRLGTLGLGNFQQLSLFGPTKEDNVKCLTGQI